MNRNRRARKPRFRMDWMLLHIRTGDRWLRPFYHDERTRRGYNDEVEETAR